MVVALSMIALLTLIPPPLAYGRGAESGSHVSIEVNMSMSIHTDMWRYHHNQYDVIMFEEVRRDWRDLPLTLTLHNNTYKVSRKCCMGSRRAFYEQIMEK